MKKIIFLLSIVFMIPCSYAGNPPAAVQKAFEQKFPNAANIKWDKENAHEYEASFEWKGDKLSANFYDTGEWLETESPLTFNALPENVQTAFNASHKGATVKAVAKIETSKGVTKYEVEIKQGIKTVEFLYKIDGTEIK